MVAFVVVGALCLLGATAAAAADPQCAQPYANISDVWRSVYHDCGGGGCAKPGCSPPDGPPANCSCRPGGPATGPCPQSHHRDKGGPGGHWMGDMPLSKGCSGYAKATGVGGDRWYRFMGPAGDALPLTPPGVDHCGASKAGWLSGWNSTTTAPPQMFNQSGKYPVASDGVVERTACFNHGPPNANTVRHATPTLRTPLHRLPSKRCVLCLHLLIRTSVAARCMQWCLMHTKVGVVRCEGFFLFRLADSGGCAAGYCAAVSGVN